MFYPRILEQSESPFAIYRAYVFPSVSDLKAWCEKSGIATYTIFSNDSEFAVGICQVAVDAGFVKVMEVRQP